MQNYQIAGNSLEILIPSYNSNIMMAELTALGMVKIQNIRQSAAKFPLKWKKVQRLNGNWLF